MVGGAIMAPTKDHISWLPLLMIVVAVLTVLLNLRTAGLLAAALDPQLRY
jgi:hypothetical protein